MTVSYSVDVERTTRDDTRLARLLANPVPILTSAHSVLMPQPGDGYYVSRPSRETDFRGNGLQQSPYYFADIQDCSPYCSLMRLWLYFCQTIGSHHWLDADGWHVEGTPQGIRPLGGTLHRL